MSGGAGSGATGGAARKSTGALGTAGGSGVGATATNASAVLAAIKRGAQRTTATAAKETSCALVEARLFCLCHMPHSDGVLMVSCDTCAEWFHPQCLGVPLEDTKRQSSFVCPACKRAGAGEAGPPLLPAPDLYCVCRSGDESSVMIACDFCPEW